MIRCAVVPFAGGALVVAVVSLALVVASLVAPAAVALAVAVVSALLLEPDVAVLAVLLVTPVVAQPGVTQPQLPGCCRLWRTLLQPETQRHR